MPDPLRPDAAVDRPSDTPSRPRTLREELTSDEARERYRASILTSIGGWSGMVVAALPTVVFVAVNIGATLRTAVIAAVGTAVGLALYRLARRQSPLQAGSGLIGVIIAAGIAFYTGEARNYFLVGILTSFGYGLAFLVSMAVRRPLVGLLWEFLDPVTTHVEMRSETELAEDPQTRAHPDDVEARTHVPWYRRPDLLKAYQLATLAGVVVFLGRAVAQLFLYLLDWETALGVARIALGTPLWLAGVVFAFWVVRRTRRRLVAPPASV